MHDVRCLLLLAKVYQSHRKDNVLQTLSKVTDKQARAPYLPFSDGGCGRKDRTTGLEGSGPCPQRWI